MSGDKIDFVPIALAAHAAGLSCIPTKTNEKRPITIWKEFQTRLPTEEETKQLFQRADRIGVVTGKVSGGLEILDFDFGGIDFEKWSVNVPEVLKQRLVIERSPSGGYHVAYRCPEITGNKKLTIRSVDGKKQCTIETRGEGGFCVISPTSGYELIQGDWLALPTITTSERKMLWNAALVLSEKKTVKKDAIRLSTKRHTRSDDELKKRAIAYIGKCNPAISGQMGHNATVRVASCLRYGFEFDVETCIDLMLNYYNPQCQPPWTEGEIRHKVESCQLPEGKTAGWLRDGTDDALWQYSSFEPEVEFSASLKIPELDLHSPVVFTLSETDIPNAIVLDHPFQWRSANGEIRNDITSVCDWNGRTAVVQFNIKPDQIDPVAVKAACDFAAQLEELGAISVLPHFEQTIEMAIKSETEFVCSLSEYRLKMQESRDLVTEPGFYFNGAETGSGKSYGDMQFVKQYKKTITILPTHDQIGGTMNDYQNAGIPVISYPVLTDKNCERFEETQEIQKLGLSVPGVLCCDCELKPECVFYKQYEEAKKAKHTICTHKRFEYTTGHVMDKKEFVTIHENLIDVLAPKVEEQCCFSEVKKLIPVVLQKRREKRVEFDVEEMLFFDMVYYAAELFDKAFTSDRNHEVDLSELSVAGRPRGLDKSIYEAIKEIRTEYPDFSPCGEALRLCILAACGDLKHVHRIGNFLLGIVNIPFSKQAVVLLNDATTSCDEIEKSLARPVVDITPEGRVVRLHNVIQYPNRDVTNKTSPKRILNIIRLAMAQYPEAKRIGIISQKEHLNEEGCVLNLLAPEERRRIVKYDWFHGTESRGSNSWKDECDLLLILGTPRIPEYVVRTRLVQMNLPAGEGGVWGPIFWSARDENGKRHTVEGRGYLNRNWNKAHRSCVQAELLQCIGRARSITEDGIPCLIFSSEPLPFTRIGKWGNGLSDNAAMVYQQLRNMYGPGGVCTTHDIAKTFNLPGGSLFRILNELTEEQLLVRQSQGEYSVC